MPLAVQDGFQQQSQDVVSTNLPLEIDRKGLYLFGEISMVQIKVTPILEAFCLCMIRSTVKYCAVAMEPALDVVFALDSRSFMMV